MAYNLVGFLFRNRKKPEVPQTSFAPPPNDDGAVVVEQGGAFTTVVDLDGVVKNEIELVTKYREMSQRAQVEGAISEIVNEAIVIEQGKAPIALVTDKLNYSDALIQKIQAEFDTILGLLDFNNEAQDIFRQWYIDGRLYYHIVIDNANPRDGIQELRPIDPRRIKPVIETETFVDQHGVPMQVEKQRYYVYNQYGSDAMTTTTGVKIAWDSICYVHSGLRETNNTMILGHLHKALKPANMLAMVEDATVIYRLSRAPERRVFFIDVGNLPKQKAEQYLKDIMSKYRNKMVYDATTGEVREDKKFLSFMEDYWLPRREGGKGTEITTLPGGENLGEMADVEYFKENLYQSLNVPVGRLNSESGFNLGRTAEITRDEVKFGKFIDRIRNRFNQLFDDLLSTQLMLKGIITREDWQVIRQKIWYTYLKDTYFSELKNLEIIQNRMAVADSCLSYVGKYVSHEWMRREILRQTDEEFNQLDQQMLREKSDPRYQAIEAMTGMMPGMPPMPGGMGMDPMGGMGGDPSMGGQDPSMMGGGNPNGQQPPMPPQGAEQGDEDDESDAPEEGDDEQAQQQQMMPPMEDPEDEMGLGLNPDDLPTERVTKNVEALWRTR